MKYARATPPEPGRLLSWVERMRGLTAVVWGDFVLDEYWRCLTRRVSREAPVLVLDWQSREAQGGGAANAALNLVALGARVRAVGWVGADAAGEELGHLLSAAGVDVAGLLLHPDAATVVKTRIVAGSVHTALQQVVRVDRGAAFPPGATGRAALSRALERAARGAQAVVLSDYGYDSVTPALAAPHVRAWQERRVPVALDARYRLAGYRGVTLATPNESEAAAAAGLEIASVRDLARVASRLLRVVGADHLLITRGRDGLTLWERDRGVSLEAFGGEEAVDVTGAGDAVVATATLALAAGAPALEAAALANVAGSVAVSRRGAVAVSAADLERALGRAARARRARAARSPRGAGEGAAAGAADGAKDGGKVGGKVGAGAGRRARAGSRARRGPR
ncbi:MAG TPA: PfkB family carbohydrate kinase [Candidatus Eisenbacteria bacterium]